MYLNLKMDVIIVSFLDFKEDENFKFLYKEQGINEYKMDKELQ